MPLFNKFTPLETADIRSAILDYARSVGFPLSGIFVIDGSKRSSKTNAFFTGFGRTKRIALFDTLVAKHPIQELVAIIAHEIGHYKKKHILKSTVLGILQAALLFYLLSLFITRKELFDAFFMERTPLYAGLVFFGILYTPVELILSLFLQAFSRKNEFEADKFALSTTPDKSAMIEALKKLSLHNLSHLTPHPLYVLLNYSHPPVLQRIKAISASTG
jgi:STE24 endopeptidase